MSRDLVKFSYRKISQRCLETGMSKREVCEKAGVLSAMELMHIIIGRWNPTAYEFLKIHSVLGCSMRDMVDLDVEYRDTVEEIHLGGTKLSYRPLREFLKAYNQTPYGVFGGICGYTTITKMNQDRDMNMKMIAFICKYLRIPPDKVMMLE